MTAQDDIRQIATERSGLVTRSQARAVGLTESQWRSGAGGLLEPVFTGIKRLVVTPVPSRDALRRQRSQAAVIIGGPEATACSGAALRIHGLIGTPLGDEEGVCLPTKGLHQRKGIRRHWFDVPPDDAVLVDGLPAVCVVPSLVEVAADYDDAHFLSVLDSALHLRKIGAADRESLLVALPGRAALVRFADGRRESPLESRTAFMMAEERIRNVVPQVQISTQDVGDVRVDFKIGRSVIVECDGKDAHDDISTRYFDRKRQDALERLGYIVVRVTWDDVVHRPVETADRIRRALADADARARGWLPRMAAG